MGQHVRQAVGAVFVTGALAIAGCAESRPATGDEAATLRECAGSDCVASPDAGADEGDVQLELEPDAPSEPPPVVSVTPALPTFASYQRALESCGLVRESAYDGESHEHLQTLLLRDWFLCERGAWWNEDEVGIRIDPDGHWTLLLLEGDSIVLARDVSQKGDFTWGDDGTGSGGHPAILMDLATNPGNDSWEVYVPTFSDDPLRMYEWPAGRSDHEIELVAAE